MRRRCRTHRSVWDIDCARNVASLIGLRCSRIDKKDLVSSPNGFMQILGVDFVLELRFVVLHLIVHTYLLPDQQIRLSGIFSILPGLPVCPQFPPVSHPSFPNVRHCQAMTDPLVGARRRFRGLIEPGFETRLAELRVIARKECPLANVHAVVARLRVCNNLARILVCGQVLPA